MNPTGHTPVIIPAVAPTCTEAGSTVGVRCAVCETLLIAPELLEATGHAYGEPEWTWNEELTAASAKFVCANCGDQQTVEAIITGEILTEATFHLAGEKKLTAKVTFNGKDYTDEKLVTLEALPCPCAHFEDLPAYGTPEHEAIDWAFAHGYTSGMDETHFGTGTTLTRAQTAAFMWAASGKPEIDLTLLENPFSDVKTKKWYAPYVLWAADQGLVSGYEDGTFRPESELTRAEILQLLYAWAGKPSVEGVENPYSDAKPSKWFHDAALWASDLGIERGANGKFSPNTKVLREVFVLYLYRCMEGRALAD